MSNNEEYIFENVPRKPLPRPFARSKLLAAFADELTAQSQKAAGKRVLQLSDLGTCPDEELRPMIPIMLPKSKISIKDGFVIGASSMTGKSYRLFPIASPALTAFNLINGFNTLEQISQRLEQETGWEAARSFAYTRGLFLSLVVGGLCMPKE